MHRPAELRVAAGARGADRYHDDPKEAGGIDQGLLELPIGLARSIRAAALRAVPRESCGLLLGRIRAERDLVQIAVAAVNRSPRADRFVISPRDVWAAMRRAERARLQLIGAYHSHPGASAEPSHVDVREAWGELLQLIVACDGNATPMRCWRPSAGGFAEVRVRILDTAC